MSSGKQFIVGGKKHKSNIFPVYCTLKVWILFVLHSCCLSSWSQWWPWGAQCFRRACHTPTIFWVPKNNLGKLCLCIAANHGNVSADSVDSASLWTPMSLSFSAMQRYKGYIRLLNSRYLSNIFIWCFFFFIQLPVLFLGIVVNVLPFEPWHLPPFWSHLCKHFLRCCNWLLLQHTLPPASSILYCFQVVTFTNSLHSFLPPSSSVSPSRNVPAPLANRRKNTSWFLCLVSMKQSKHCQVSRLTICKSI